MLPIENPAAFAKRIAALKPFAVAMCHFQHSDRPFVSTTRADALLIAKQFGWDEREYEKTRAELKRHLADLVNTERGFGPA
ncbi:MAG: hypothetical protein QOJ65_1250 [Fimbriimonadaceae bacterium]|nr:hypothetical protein [Fimbriimonadaceae bacterium]